MIDNEFLERCKAKEFQEKVEEHYRLGCYINDKWKRENPEIYRERKKEYFKTDKGRYAVSKKNSTRRNKFNAACEDLSWEEKRNIGRFYKNCPKGYEVDHIIPVSKGGKHRLSNLQYLTKEENRAKSNKIKE